MSFSDLDLDQADQALVDELKAAVRRSEYHSSPDQVFENLDADLQIPNESVADSPASRRDFLNHLKTRRSAGACLPHGREFCRTHQRQGEKAASGAIFGQAQDLDKLAASPYALKEVRDWLRNLVDLPGEPAARLERQRADIEKATLSRYQMWSFYTDDRTAPFTPVAPRRSELFNRLGLGHFDPAAELVYWTLSLPAEMTAHRPTAWDADLNNPYWRPTGRTEPLDGSGSTHGFPEVVHSPVGPKDLVGPIERAEP